MQAFERLLELVGITEPRFPKEYWYDGIDCKEKQLKPSKRHLIELIKYISHKDFGDAEIKNEKRRRLCIPDPENADSRKEACAEAIDELENTYVNLTATDRAWYVFEGFTNPDIFIEGEDYVILCEGKWTEPHITIQTTNLAIPNKEYRNQMIRHIQGALNYTDKKVYAFYIVDRECGYLQELSPDKLKEQLSLETIKIEDSEKEKIMNAFKGYVTWQDIENVIPSAKFKTKQEINADDQVKK